MEYSNHAFSRVVLCEVRTNLGSSSVVRARWEQPIDLQTRGDYHHLQLSLMDTLTKGQGCFPETWGPNRFEPIGSMFLTPAHQMIHAKSNCVEQQSIVCNFSTASLEKWFDCDFDWTSRRLTASLDLADPEIRRLLLRIGKELQSPGFAAEPMVELLTGQIAIELARLLRGIELPTHSGGLASWRLRLIDDYLADHAGRTSLGELADLCQLSVRQLSRGFKVSRGRSIGAYIGEFKMDLARRLLAGGNPVKVVAGRLGFSSPSNFSSAFQRALGENPRDYRLRASRH